MLLYQKYSIPYEYSRKSSAHSQHYQTPKACDIDDLVVNNIHYCTYLYALIQIRTYNNAYC